MPQDACDLYLLCGEASGDAYAAGIVRRLRERAPAVRIAGIGCGQLAASGVPVDERMDDRAVMGVGAVLRRLPEFLALGQRVEAAVRARRPRLVLGIDYPGFNLRLLARLEDLSGCQRWQLVAPQVWAWRPRRAKRIARSVDRLLCFFPFEPPLFARFGGDARAIGHPLVDLVAADPQVDPDLPDLPGSGPILLLAPGGRRREVEDLLPDFLRASALLGRRVGQLRPVIAAAEDVPAAAYRCAGDVPVVRGCYRSLCRSAHAGLIASGTATLEAALCELPHVLAYRMDRVSGRIARHLIRTPWVGLPNIVHGHLVAREYLQDACTPTHMARGLERIWSEPEQRRLRRQLARTADRLGGGGALERVVDQVIEQLAAAPAQGSGARL